MTIGGKEPGKSKIEVIILTFICFLIIAVLMSCSARTSEVTKTKSLDEVVAVKKEVVIVNQESNVKKEVKKEVVDNGSVVKETTTVTPIDNTKDAFVDIPGKGLMKLNNSKYVNEKSSSNTNTTYYETLSLQENKKKDSLFALGSLDVKKKEETQDLKKTNKSSPVFYWLVTLAAALAGLYVYYRINPYSKVFNILKKK
jgi:hypothetical protein